MASQMQLIHNISKSMVKPSSLPQSISDQRSNLTPWDLSLLSLHYIQWGLLFSTSSLSLKGNQVSVNLKTSLSAALSHFYPLAGRLITKKDGDNIYISINCENGEGVEFIHAVAEKVTINDVLAPDNDVPNFIRSFFPLDGAINYDGHFLPLLAVQVTELADGIFLGCSFNHVVGDGNCFWNFIRAWAEICRTKLAAGVDEVQISHPPILDRLFIEGVDPPIKLPFSHCDEFVERYTPPSNLRQRIFHFASSSLAFLKLKANDECKTENKISSFQALCSLVWRTLARSHCLPPEQQTSFRQPAEIRSRLRPPMSSNYFGNTAVQISTTTTVGELLGHGIGWGARLINESVAAHNDAAIRNGIRAWMDEPFIYRPQRFGMAIGSSPRFDVYGCDFGWGKPVAWRSGSANKYDGKVLAYPGWEAGGGMDLEVCLSPEAMDALLSDDEFVCAISR